MMSIFTCSSPPEKSRDKQALATIEAQIQAVSTMINGLRERVAELSTECNARIGDCAARVREMERRLDNRTGPLESMHSDELQRVLYILELIKKDQGQKRRAKRD